MPKNEQPPVVFLLSFMRQHRFAVLLFAIVLMFCYGPIAELFVPRLKGVAARVLVGITFTFLLLSAVLSVAEGKKTIRHVLLLAIPAIICELLDVTMFRSETHVISHATSLLFLSYVLMVLIKFIFSSERVTTNTLFASMCIYLLMGIMWAMVYSLIEWVQPNAFHYSLAASSNSTNHMRIGGSSAGLEFYYSLVTMTTLGYGDVVPVKSAARMASTLQAVVGQLYLAVIVARLVGLHVASSLSR